MINRRAIVCWRSMSSFVEVNGSLEIRKDEIMRTGLFFGLGICKMVWEVFFEVDHVERVGKLCLLNLQNFKSAYLSVENLVMIEICIMQYALDRFFFLIIFGNS